MHGAETRTRALSLRADTLKRCDTGDLQRESNPQLIPLRDKFNHYATPTVVIVVVFTSTSTFPFFCLPIFKKQMNPLHENDVVVLLVILIHIYQTSDIINLNDLCLDYFFVDDDKVVIAAALLLLLLLMMTIVLSSSQPLTAATTTSVDVGNCVIISAATLCVISRSTIAVTLWDLYQDLFWDLYSIVL